MAVCNRGRLRSATAMEPEVSTPQDNIELEFWYDFASPYSYLAASRIEKLVADQPIRLVWKPFLIGPILKRRPSDSSPFQNASPEEARYRRRDVERYCRLYGLPLAWPSAYPRGSLIATRLALIAADEGWCGEFTKAVFNANFAADRDIAVADVVADILEDLGHSAHGYLQRAALPEIKARLKAQVDEAQAKSIFGAPSFVVAGELFWGNDRLELAIEWSVNAASQR